MIPYGLQLLEPSTNFPLNNVVAHPKDFSSCSGVMLKKCAMERGKVVGSQVIL